jgi:lipopolysaccharide/colanic/teichoic acid biosynthesis glycosyltransferase
MVSGWRYRIASVGGVCCITAAAVAVANHPLVQRGATMVPVFGRLPAVTMTNGNLALAIATTLVIVLGSIAPLFKPRPRRLLDTLVTVEYRVLIAVFALAAIGYFDYTYRLPRTTLVLTTGLVAVLCPAWFLLIHRQPATEPRRAVVVGDDPDAIEDVLDATEIPIIGYVSPPSPRPADEMGGGDPPIGTPDGGQLVEQPLDGLECLGGLSRLDEVLVKHDVDAAVLAFSRPDRAEFFGTLDTLYDHGVTAKVHRDHADTVLTTGMEVGELVDVDIDPWDWQDYVLKRLFDVGFAATGLLVLAPLMALIAVAIKLDSAGPVLYRQTRTAVLGESLTIFKFRSMVVDAEAGSGATLSDEDAGGIDPRVTRVGRVLRKTHLDELPQLWLILWGDMTVVGPRPERPTLDQEMETDVGSWRKRWFVKPGLTGLAQINDATGFDPAEKLRHDVTYIRNQSLLFDLKILLRQLWQVAGDVVGLLRSSTARGNTEADEPVGNDD